MLKIGTSGFSFVDWLGNVYPKDLPKDQMLVYYANELKFDCVEINATYYALMGQNMFSGMLKKTPPGFEFVVKGFRGTTHDPFDYRLKDKKPIMQKTEEDTKKFAYSIDPLKKEGRLGGVLLQYPVFFTNNKQNQGYILKCKEWLGDVPLIVEFRNQGWATPIRSEHSQDKLKISESSQKALDASNGASFDTYEFLRKHKIGFCVVDEPQLPRLMPFVNITTSNIGYLRFHGRNPNWFNAPMEERYNYLYSDKELEEFIPEITKLAKSTDKTYLFFNNCHMGFAAKNGLRLKDFLAQHGNLF